MRLGGRLGAGIRTDCVCEKSFGQVFSAIESAGSQGTHSDKFQEKQEKGMLSFAHPTSPITLIQVLIPSRGVYL